MLKENLVLEMMQLWKCKIAGVKAVLVDKWAQANFSSSIMGKGQIAVTCESIVAGNFI